jgi:hypothetical protein
MWSRYWTVPWRARSLLFQPLCSALQEQAADGQHGEHRQVCRPVAALNMDRFLWIWVALTAKNAKISPAGTATTEAMIFGVGKCQNRRRRNRNRSHQLRASR